MNTQYFSIIYISLLLNITNVSLFAHNKKVLLNQLTSPKRTEQIKALRTLITLVQKGKCLDEALTIAQNLSHSTDPLIQDILCDLNNAIAQWCITTIENIFN